MDIFLQTSSSSSSDGEFVWETDLQGYILSSFFYGYVLTQIPFGILAKKYGNIYFLGVGMLINSLFGLLVPIAAHMGIYWLIAVRFIQGLGEVIFFYENSKDWRKTKRVGQRFWRQQSRDLVCLINRWTSETSAYIYNPLKIIEINIYSPFLMGFMENFKSFLIALKLKKIYDVNGPSYAVI